jgi:hypothetical protein
MPSSIYIDRMQAAASDLEAEYLRTRDPDTWRRYQLFDGMARILNTVHQHPGNMSLVELARLSGLSIFRASVALKQMENYGVIDKHVCG